MALTPEQIAELQKLGWLPGAPNQSAPSPPAPASTPDSSDQLGKFMLSNPVPPPAAAPAPVAPVQQPVSNAHPSPTGFGALNPATGAAAQQAAAVQAVAPSASPAPSTTTSVDLANPKAPPGSLVADAGKPGETVSTPSFKRPDTLPAAASPVTMKPTAPGEKKEEPLTPGQEYIKTLQEAERARAARSVLVDTAVGDKARAESDRAIATSAASFEVTQQAETRMQEEKSRMDAAQAQADADDAESKRRAQDLAMRKIDPKRLFHQASLPQKIGMVLAQALGAFGATLGHTPNFAMQMIQSAVDRDVQAQRDDIQNATNSAQMLDQLSRQRYGRALSLNEFSQRQRQDAYNYALHQVDAIAKSYDSPIAQANGEILRNQLLAESDQQKVNIAAGIYKVHQDEEAAKAALARARAAGAGNAAKEAEARRKEFRGLVAKFMEQGDDLQKAQARALGVFGQLPGSAGNLPALTGKPSSKGEKDKLSETEQEMARSYKSALDNLYKIRDMIKAGGELSPSRTAEGHSLVAGAKNALARAETGGHRAPSPDELKILEDQLPGDPNAWQFSGKELKRIETTITQAENALKRVETGGAGGIDYSPDKVNEEKKDEAGFKPEE